MPVLQRFSFTSSSLSTTAYHVIRTNSDIGVVRIKSLHLDFVISPASGATQPLVVDIGLHRVHEDVPNANLVITEGSRIKFERLTIGEGTDRYYRLFFKEVNLEFGYAIRLVMEPIDVAGGSPGIGIGGRWWELTPDSA